MAVYLTPRFRRLRSQSELEPRRGSGRRRGGDKSHGRLPAAAAASSAACAGLAAAPGQRDCDGPFQATQLWNSIIHALHSQVEIKRRRQHLRTYKNCFTGSNAVDVVLSHLMQSMYLSCNDISRLKGVRVCQALMDHKVFEPIGAKLYLFKNEKETEFEDTNTSLYKFVNTSLTPLLPRKNKDSESLSSEQICKQKTKRLIEDVWKQQTLLRLLQLIDVPLLEDILVSSVKTKPDVRTKTNFSFYRLDKWLYAAIECLEYFPDQFIVMVSQQLPQSTNKPCSLNMYKKILFDTIIKYYSQKKDSLLDTQDLDIHSGIIDLIEKGKTDQALEASQLYLKLLAPNIQEELHRLLTFIAIASESDSYKLQKQFENRLVIIKTCTKFILQSKTLSKPQAELLTQFLMDNHSDLFKTPLTLLELTSRRLESLLEGQDPDTSSGFTFCQRVTTKEYEEQKQQTNQYLLALVREMDNDLTIPLKQKKKLVKEFRKYHSLYFDNIYGS
uniref:DEP domain containing 4 n=1 Tax=Strigops habroptila TaxID=2489341 RepID=A0A672UNH9_STRHB